MFLRDHYQGHQSFWGRGEGRLLFPTMQLGLSQHTMDHNFYEPLNWINILHGCKEHNSQQNFVSVVVNTQRKIFQWRRDLCCGKWHTYDMRTTNIARAVSWVSPPFGQKCQHLVCCGEMLPTCWGYFQLCCYCCWLDSQQCGQHWWKTWFETLVGGYNDNVHIASLLMRVDLEDDQDSSVADSEHQDMLIDCGRCVETMADMASGRHPL